MSYQYTLFSGNSVLVEEVPFDHIRHGDCIICQDGHDRTVAKKDIISDTLGQRIFGEPYYNGKPVKRVLIPKWKGGQLVGYVTQR